MRTCAVPLSLSLVCAAAICGAQGAHEALRLSPSDFEWEADPDLVQSIPVTGDSDTPGLYAYRVRFPAGFRNQPHFHPDDRIVTVIEGVLHVGFGETFRESAMRPLSAGSLWTEPANQPHFVWARDGNVVIQVVGVGPSGTTQVSD